jgi:ABC-type transport system involved in cytochrome bd biosynthesis fused ATPase/permease subunit
MKRAIKIISLTVLLLGIPYVVSAQENQNKEQYQNQYKEQYKYQNKKDLEYQKQIQEQKREMKKSQNQGQETYRFEESKGAGNSSGSGKNR